VPIWARTAFVQSVIAYLIVTPLLAWFGVSIGTKYRSRKQAEQ
jgi:hypothetical protein